MSEKPFILDFDNDQHAVLEPTFEKLPYKFHSRLLYAFVPEDEVNSFLEQHPHKVLGKFKTISFRPQVYEVEINNQKFTLCQAPLGAPAAVKLLDWLIAYGVRKVLAFGNAGALKRLPENAMFIPVKAIRDEGMSFHYKEPGQFVDLQSNFLSEIETKIKDLGYNYDEIVTWTTDGFFRETSKKVTYFKELGAATVEMECAALAACAQFRSIEFAKILFTGDTLADMDNYDRRGWGRSSYGAGLNIGSEIISRI